MFLWPIVILLGLLGIDSLAEVLGKMCKKKEDKK
jgi:hypothetical protein